jgi:hypothetical protein
MAMRMSRRDSSRTVFDEFSDGLLSSKGGTATFIVEDNKSIEESFDAEHRLIFEGGIEEKSFEFVQTRFDIVVHCSQTEKRD